MQPAPKPAAPPEISLADAYLCDQCESLIRDSERLEGENLYECSSCGTTFISDSNRCELCNKFSAKLSDDPCPSCREGGLNYFGKNYLVDGELYSSLSEANKALKNTPVRKAAMQERVRRSDELLASTQSSSDAKALVQLYRLPRVMDAISRLALVYPGDISVSRLLVTFSKALYDQENGNEDVAIRCIRNLGLTVQLDIDVFLTLCEGQQ